MCCHSLVLNGRTWVRRIDHCIVCLMTDSILDTSAPSRDRRQRVQAAVTGMMLLKGLARLGGRATLTLLARHVDENPAKVHRYLISMIEEGLVVQDPVSLQYQLGPESIQIGLAAMRLADPVRSAEPSLVRLRQSLEMTCFVAVMGNKGPTIVRFEEPGLPVTLNVRVGSVLSVIWSATGRVFLAYLDDSRMERLAQEELAQVTPSQRTTLDAMDPIGHLKAQTRSVGMAIVRDTNLQGISAIGAPVFDFSGKLVAVVTVLGATGMFDEATMDRVMRALKEETQAISTGLGQPVATLSPPLALTNPLG